MEEYITNIDATIEFMRKIYSEEIKFGKQLE